MTGVQTCALPISGLAHSYYDIAEEIAAQESVPLELIDGNHTDIYTSKADLTLLKATIGKRKWLNIYEWLDRGL